MKKNRIFQYALLYMLITAFTFRDKQHHIDDRFVSYIADPKKQELKFYWKDDKQELFGNMLNLKNWLEVHHRKLEFAMNGGMYKKDFSPQGLFIENQQIISDIDTTNGEGNFYLKPNGVFYLTIDNIPVICSTSDFRNDKKIKYATQSGPMLIIDGQIHPAFKQGSTNLNIRNGVGILPGNRILFAMSRTGINFYDFAAYFKNQGCRYALYLDGFISRTYLPSQNWTQTDGNLAVIIAVTTTVQ